MQFFRVPIFKGEQYGRLTVIDDTPIRRANLPLAYQCLCSCGQITTPAGSQLKSGKTRSCGCLKVETTIKRSTTHQMTHTKEWNSWRAAKERCTNPKHIGWMHYGGKGIKFCARWSESFEAFFQDMGPCPHGYCIERIDSNGHYEPNNCVWIKRSEQNRNRSTTHWVNYGGQRITLTELAIAVGAKQKTVHHQFLKQGLTVEQIADRASR